MRYTLTLFSFCLLFLTCSREDIEEMTIDTTLTPPIITLGDGDIQFRGRVLSENNFPLGDVLITAGSSSTLSDNNGNYILPAVETNPDGGAFISISRDGYFREYRQFYPREASTNMLDIVMSDIRSDDLINGATGGTFESPDGVKIAIPAGAALSGGLPYTGDIRVKIIYEDPTSYTDIEQSGANIPGWKDGELVELATYGMAKISLTTVRDDQVFFPADQPVTLEMPLPEVLAGSNESILFWQLQEQVWSFQGEVSNNNGFLSANITSGGDYNLDVPFPRATICGTLVDPDGVQLQNTPFALLVNGAFVFTTFTNEKGQFCVQVPRDELLNIRIPDPCAPEESLYEATLGPFPEGPTQIGDILVDITLVQKPFSITDCTDGSPFTQEDGFLWVNGFGFGLPVGTNSEGLANVSLPDCDGNGEIFEVQAVANDERRTSSVARVTAQDLSTVELEVCSEPEGEEFLQLTISNAGDFDMDELSYLLRQGQFGRISHQIWGRSIVGTDTTEIFFSFLELVTSGNNAFVPDLFRNEGSFNSYFSTCIGCPGANSLRITEVGPDQSFIRGTFIGQGSQRSEDNGLIESGVTVSGSFYINR